MEKIVGYARISTRDQGETAIEQQISRLLAAGAEEIISEIESARGKSDRPQFNHLMERVRQNKVKKIIVTRLDRISRSLPHLRKILDDFQKFGCDLVALDDNIDMSSAAGKFQINMLGALAEMESDRLSERIHHGKRHFRHEKRASHPPFGYLVENYKFKVDRTPFLCIISDKTEWSKAQLALWLIECYLINKSLLGSCKSFIDKFGYQLFWSTSFSRWIRNSTLEGHTTYFPNSTKSETHYNTHEALISGEQAREIKNTLKFNKQLGGWGSTTKYPLSGLVKCECGFNCNISNGGYSGKTKYYVCSKGKYKQCSSKGVRYELIENAVINKFCDRADEIARIAIQGEKTESLKVKELKSQLSILKSISGKTQAIINAILEIESEIELETKLTNSNQFEIDIKKDLVSAFAQPDCWANASDKDKFRIYRELVELICVFDGELIEVRLSF